MISIRKQAISLTLIFVLIFEILFSSAELYAYAASDDDASGAGSTELSLSSENVVEKGTDYTVYDMGDGTRGMEIYQTDVRTTDEDGNLEDIDNSLRKVETAGETYYQNRNSFVDVMLPTEITSDNPITISEKGNQISFLPISSSENTNNSAGNGAPEESTDADSSESDLDQSSSNTDGSSADSGDATANSENAGDTAADASNSGDSASASADESSNSTSTDTESTLTLDKTIRENTEDLYHDTKKQTTGLSYSGKVANVQYEYFPMDFGLKENIILQKRPESNRFQFLFRCKGRYLKKDHRAILVLDRETDKVKAVLAEPYMTDSSDTENSGFSEDADYSFEELDADKGIYRITLTVSRDYLDSEDRVYPVTIDPPVTLNSSSTIKDVYVLSKHSSTNFYSSGIIKMCIGYGPNDGKCRTYVKFPTLQSKISGTYITSATLKLTERNNTKPYPTVGLYRVTGSWDLSKIKYNNQPSFNSTAIATSKLKGGTNTHTLNVTSLVQGWAKGSYKNYGILLKATSESSSSATFCEFFGGRYGTASKRPKLTVYYTVPSRPVPTKPTVSVNRTAIQRGTANITVKWEGIDTNILAKTQVKLLRYDENNTTYALADANGKIFPYTDTGINEKSGSYTLDTSSLEEGKYAVVIRGVDKLGKVGDGTSAIFYVDSSPPNAPVIRKMQSSRMNATSEDAKVTIEMTHGKENPAVNPSGVSKTTVSLYNAANNTLIGSAKEISAEDTEVTFEDVESGTEVYAKAVTRDLAGNESAEVRSDNFTVQALDIPEFDAKSDFTSTLQKNPWISATNDCTDTSWNAAYDGNLGKITAEITNTEGTVTGYEEKNILADESYPKQVSHYHLEDDFDLAALPEGEYTVHFRFYTPGESNVGYREKTLSLRMDNHKPAVQRISPTDGETVSGMVEIAYTVTDEPADQGALANLEVRLTGNHTDRVLSESNEVIQFNSTEYEDGDYTIQITGTDKAGNRSEPVSCGITISNPPPTPRIHLSPEIGKAGTARTLSWDYPSGDQSVSKVTKLEYAITTGESEVAETDFETLSEGSAAAKDGSFEITTPDLSDGEYILSVRSSDANGNTGNVRMLSYTLDDTDPQIAVTSLRQSSALSGEGNGTSSDTNAVFGLVYIRGEISDDHLQSYSISVASGDTVNASQFGNEKTVTAPEGATNVTGYLGTVDLTDESAYPVDSDYTIRIRAVDAAGNEETQYYTVTKKAAERVEADFEVERPERGNLTVMEERASFPLKKNGATYTPVNPVWYVDGKTVDASGGIDFSDEDCYPDQSAHTLAAVDRTEDGLLYGVDTMRYVLMSAADGTGGTLDNLELTSDGQLQLEDGKSEGTLTITVPNANHLLSLNLQMAASDENTASDGNNSNSTSADGNSEEETSGESAANEASTDETSTGTASANEPNSETATSLQGVKYYLNLGTGEQEITPGEDILTEDLPENVTLKIQLTRDSESSASPMVGSWQLMGRSACPEEFTMDLMGKYNPVNVTAVPSLNNKVKITWDAASAADSDDANEASGTSDTNGVNNTAGEADSEDQSNASDASAPDDADEDSAANNTATNDSTANDSADNTADSDDAITYEIERSTSADFTASETTCIASGVTDRYFLDNYTLVDDGNNMNDAEGTRASSETLSDVKLYYRVRAVKTAGSRIRRSAGGEDWASVPAMNEYAKRLGKKDYLGYSGVDVGMGNGAIEQSTGNFVYQETDAYVKGKVLDLSLERTYNSMSTGMTALGYGWDYSFSPVLLETYNQYGDATGMLFQDGSGTIYTFRTIPGQDAAAAETHYQSPMGTYIHLTKKNTDGEISYTIGNLVGDTYTFNGNSQLESFRDANGNQVEYTYDANGRLQSVENPNRTQSGADTAATGKSIIRFHYRTSDDALEEELIRSVTLPGGQVVEYEYNDDKVLVGTKLRNSASEDSDDVIETHYEYALHSTLMTGIQDANGNESTIEYYTSQVNPGRCKAVTYANGDGESFRYRKEATGKEQAEEQEQEEPSQTPEQESSGEQEQVAQGSQETEETPDSEQEQADQVPVQELEEDALLYDSMEQTSYRAGTLGMKKEIGKATYHFNADGNVIASTDIEGGEVTSKYSLGLEIETTGDSCTYSVDENGRITKGMESVTSITEYDRIPDGNTLAGKIASSKGNVTKETDISGNVTTYSYGASGEANQSNPTKIQTTAEDGAAAHESFTYDANGNLTSAADKDTGERVTYSYDGNGQVTEEQEYLKNDTAGEKTTYTYDALGNVISEETYASSEKTSGYDSVYDEYGRLRFERNAENYVTEHRYDVLDREVKTVYYEDRCDVSVPSGSNASERVSAYEAWCTGKASVTESWKYDANGNLTEETDRENRVTTYQYDSRDRMTRKTVTKDGQSASWTYTYSVEDIDRYFESGNEPMENALVVTETNQEGIVTSVSCQDKAGNIVKTLNKGVLTSFRYNKDGNVVEIYTLGNDEETQAGTDTGLTVLAGYDRNGDNTFNIVDPGYDEAEGLYYVADDTSLLQYRYDSLGHVRKQTDAKGHETEYRYDSNGQVTRTITAAGTGDAGEKAVTKVEYDIPQENGNTVQRMTNAMNQVSEEEKDTSGHVVRITDKGRNDGSKSIETRYTYDAAGNMTSESSASGTITYQYDGMGNVVRKITRTESGEPADYSDYTYDYLGTRTSRRDYVDGTLQRVALYRYDSMKRLVQYYEGEDPGTDDETSDIDWITCSYDIQNNLTEISYPAAMQIDRVSYTYGVYDRLTSISYDIGGQTKKAREYTYRADNRVSSVKDYTSSRHYEEKSYDYDAKGHCTEIRMADSAKGLQEKYTYAYDVSGNITSEEIMRGRSTVTGSDSGIGSSGNGISESLGAGETSGNIDGNGESSGDGGGDSSGSGSDDGEAEDGEPPGVYHIRRVYSYNELDELQNVKEYEVAGENLEELEAGSSSEADSAEGDLPGGESLDNAGNGNTDTTGEGDGSSATGDTSSSNSSTGTRMETLIHETSYTYDKIGNRQTETVDGTVYLYSYDDLNELKKVEVQGDSEGKKTVTYSYDGDGNLTQTTDHAKNTVTTYSYSVEGNMTVATSTEEKDGETITKTTRNTYNGDGTRIARTVNGETTHYIYVDGNLLGT